MSEGSPEEYKSIMLSAIYEARKQRYNAEGLYVPDNINEIMTYIRKNYPKLLNKECTITDFDINDPESMDTFYKMVKEVSTRVDGDIKMKKALLNSAGRMLEPDTEQVNNAARNMAFMDGLVKPGSYYERGSVIKTGNGPIYRNPEYDQFMEQQRQQQPWQYTGFGKIKKTKNIPKTKTKTNRKEKTMIKKSKKRKSMKKSPI